MIISKLEEFSDAQALSGISARTVATNIRDLGAAGDGFNCIGEAADAIHIRSLTAASGTATSVTITFETHTAADFTAARTVLATINTTIAALTAGKVFPPLTVPTGLLRYSTVVVTPNGGNLTASIDAFNSPSLQVNSFTTSAVGQLP